jgi:membrane protein implicated in regulation of membrane protease activity
METSVGAQTIRFLIQFAFALVAMPVVVFVSPPYGLTFGLFLLVFGLWLGRRVFKRIATLDEVKADLRQRVDDGP